MPLCPYFWKVKGDRSRLPGLALGLQIAGRASACRGTWSSIGLGSNVSTCDGPPFRNRKMTRLAFGGKVRSLRQQRVRRRLGAGASPRSPTMPKPVPIVCSSSRRVITSNSPTRIRSSSAAPARTRPAAISARTPAPAAIPRPTARRPNRSRYACRTRCASVAAQPVRQRRAPAPPRSVLFMKNSRCSGTLVAMRCSLVLFGFGKSNSASMRSSLRRLTKP